MNSSAWEERYAGCGEARFFGSEPSVLAQMAVRSWRIARGEEQSRVLDLGSGEGRDAVYFARQGFAVTAVDIAPTGIAKTERLAREQGAVLEALLCADLRAVPIDGFDLIFAGNSLNGLGAECREFLHRIQAATPVRGLNAIRIRTRETGEEQEQSDPYVFERGELRRLYEGWRLFYHGEDTIWVPHLTGYRSFADVVAQRI